MNSRHAEGLLAGPRSARAVDVRRRADVPGDGVERLGAAGKPDVEIHIDRKAALKKLLVILAALVVSLTVAPAAFADPGDSATGSGTTTLDHTFSFAATGTVGSAATGSMQFVYNPTGAFVVGTVTCLLVDGNEAVVVGNVTSTNSPFFEGLQMIFAVRDNGMPGAGTDEVRIGGYPVGFQTCDFWSSYLGNLAPLVAVGEITIIENPTAAEQLEDLIAQLQTSAAGPGSSYLSKLKTIAASVSAGATQAACNQLTAFANEVRAQAGKKLTETDAHMLLGEVAGVRTNLGCT